MSEHTAGGPPRDENDPAPQNPYEQDPASPDPFAAPDDGASPPGTDPGVPSASETAPTPAPDPDPAPDPLAGAPGTGAPEQPYGASGTPQQPYGATAPPPGGDGGYGPPPQQPPGGYPPPAGGYPPAGPPPVQAYGQQPTTGQAIPIGEAFNYGWTKFTQNAGVIILGALTYVAALAVLGILFFALFVGTASVSVNAQGELSTAGGLGFTFGTFLFAAIFFVLALFVQAVIVRISLLITHGKQIEYRDFFQVPNLGNVILAALIIGVAVGILSFTIIGGIIFAFFATFTLFFVLDKNLGAIDALKASFSLVNKNLATVIILFIAVYIAQAIGSLLCGVGLLVALPVAQIATAYVYRRLIGEQPA